jgi:sec-independent protein translocase protein TatA
MDDWSCRYPCGQASEGIYTVSLAVFQSIGPLELAIILLIVLVIFGPKRLPGLGRSLGAGMREFKDSITGKSGPELEEDEEADTRSEANAALGRPDEAAPVDGEVVRERSRS